VSNIDLSELENISESLIWDRTQTDVDYALECEKNNIYSSENLKGAYNISDRNRVGRALNYLSECIKNSGRTEIEVNIKENWIMSDIIKHEDNNNVLNAVNKLEYFLPYNNIQSTPSNLDSLTYVKANTTEHIIFDLYGVLSRLINSWLYCGEGFASDFDPFNWQGWDGN